MHCPSCVAAVELSIKDLDGVEDASLAGATDLLIHGPLSRDFEVYREKLQVIDLTQTEGFQDSLIDACSFVRLT